MPSPPALSFSPTLTRPGEDGLSGCDSRSGTAGGRPGKPNTTRGTSGTYLFIETKPGVLSATVSLPVEAVTNEETPVEQSFDQWEGVYYFPSESGPLRV
eukprot:jgi/Psemu1/431/gm1.431_g